jgi:peptidoglycan hydrolase-like protein with peptidoglycan-binding domain
MDPTHLDGDFGAETDSFVRGFQQNNGLVVLSENEVASPTTTIMTT